MFQSKKGLSLVLEIFKVVLVLMIVALPFMKLSSMVSIEDTLKVVGSEDVRQMTHIMLAYPGESAIYFEYDPDNDLEELGLDGEISSVLFTFDDKDGFITVRGEGDTIVSEATRRVYLPVSSRGIGTVYDEFDFALYYDGQDVLIERSDQFFDSIPERIERDDFEYAVSSDDFSLPEGSG